MTAGDVAETLPQLRRRLRDGKDVPATSGRIGYVRFRFFFFFFFFYIYRIFQSQACIGDVSATSPSVAATTNAETDFVRDWRSRRL